MSVKVETNGVELIRDLKESEKRRQEQMFQDLKVYVSDATTVMARNPTKGLDFEGKRFSKGYSPRYKAKREKAGYQTAPVNLTLTGNLLAAIQFKIQKLTDKIIAEIFIANTSSKPPRGFGTKPSTALEKAKGVEDLGFKFFGLSKRQINELFNMFR